MSVNVKKTKIITFNSKAHCLDFLFEGRVLERVDSFKYLGIEFHATRRGLAAAVERLADAGRRAMFALNRRCAQFKITHIKTRLELYDALVRPVLTYASEVWVGSPSADKIELVERAFLRSLLGVRPSTSNAIVRSELGRYPLSLYCWAQATKYYNRLLGLDHNRLLSKAWLAQLELLEIGAKCWAGRLRSWLLQHRAGVGRATFPDGAVNVGEVVECAKRVFESELLVREDSSSSVQRYGNIRGVEYVFQKYLEMRHCQLRQSLARFRCGNHVLEVEVGKRGKEMVPVEERVCKICQHGVEDEEHLLLRCPLYSDLRSEYLARVGVNPTCLMQEVMANPHCEALARFLVKCLDLRGNILSKTVEVGKVKQPRKAQAGGTVAVP
jgi:hypothetical protein